VDSVSDTNEEFQETLRAIVEKALEEALGSKVAAAVRFYVDLKLALRNPDRFLNIMLTLVGEEPTKLLKDRVMTALSRQYGISAKPDDRLSTVLEAIRGRQGRR